MWRYSPGMHASGRDTCYCWTRHGWKSLFVLQVLPDRDTATHTCLHNVLREPQMQRDAVALPAQQLSVTLSPECAVVCFKDPVIFYILQVTTLAHIKDGRPMFIILLCYCWEGLLHSLTLLFFN